MVTATGVSMYKISAYPEGLSIHVEIEPGLL